jgi:hypothetical protein
MEVRACLLKMLKKTKSGELIEPLKPIVYYIDPATPEGKIYQQGIDDWQIAFEKAGWKNAIRGVLARK